ncbi:hypothetical protein [Natrinema ejinorense]|nr:hypothetical protein [Natrinema ejinorense]
MFREGVDESEVGAVVDQFEQDGFELLAVTAADVDGVGRLPEGYRP